MKNFFIIIFLCLPVMLYADKDDAFGSYGFCKQVSFEAFQQYVDQTVIYLPCDPLNFAERAVFKTQKFIPESEYIVTSISPKKGRTRTVDKINLEFQDVNSGKRFKIKTDVNWVEKLPFLFIDKYNATKNSLIGKTYTDPLIKGAYKVIDVNLGKPLDNSNNRIKTIQYHVSNPEINRTFITDDLDLMIDTYMYFDKKGAYTISLAKVEKPEDPSQKFGNIETITEDSITKHQFNDDQISIRIAIDSKRFGIIIKNKTQYSIKVLWEDAVYANTEGTTSKIIHASSIKQGQIPDSQPASTIIRGSSLIEAVCPISFEPILPEIPIRGTKQIRLMLPIQIKDVVNEYVFTFELKYEFEHPERLNL